MARDPADFPGNPNPPAKAPDKAKTPAAAPAAKETSAGTGALPPESQPAAEGPSTPLAPDAAGSSFTVSEQEDGTHDVFAITDDGPQKLGTAAWGKEDLANLLKTAGATYDKDRGVYEHVPENVAKVIASGKPTFGAELKLRYGAGEAELHRAALYDSALIGGMSFADARERAHPELVQIQLAHYPGVAWKGLGDAVGRFLDHPVDEGGDLLRQGVVKLAGALPSMLRAAGGAAVGAVTGAAVGAAAGAAGGPMAGATALGGAGVGARMGTFGALLHMEVGGMAADMHEQGYDEKTIRRIAPAAGAFKAALWMYGVEAMTSPLRANFLADAAKSEAVQKVVGSWAGSYLKNIGKLALVGSAQSSVTDIAKNLGALADKRPDLMVQPKDFIKNSMRAAVDLAEISALAGLPGAGVEALGAAREAKLATEVSGKLKGVKRVEPLPSQQASDATPSGGKTLEGAGETASTGPSGQTSQAPGEKPLPTPGAETASNSTSSGPLPTSVTEHPAFVKAQEKAAPELEALGVDPADRAGVIGAYKNAAQEAHDFNNEAMKILNRGVKGEVPLTPDEEVQISARMHDLGMRMANLRDLATFMNDPEAKTAHADWEAGGGIGESPPIPRDPFNEDVSRVLNEKTKEFDDKLKDDETDLRDLFDTLDKALAEEKKAKNPLEQKTRDVEAKGRTAALTSEFQNIQQRIGELATVRDRMDARGEKTGSIDRMLKPLFDQLAEAQKGIDALEKQGKAAIVEPGAKLEIRPVQLEDIVNAGFKEGGKQSQARAKELLEIAKEAGLTAPDVRKLIGNRAPGAMGEAAYRNFVEGFERKSVDAASGAVEEEHTPGFREQVSELKERKQARADLAAVVKEKQLEREQYIRKLNNLPAFSKMTTEQLKDYTDILKSYDKGDVALTPKLIEALKGTMLEGVKTEGEARVKASQVSGRPLEDFQNVRVPLVARALPDPQLRAWFPALRPFVDLSGEMSEKGERLAETVRGRNEELAAAAIRERRATMESTAKLADWFAPQQAEVMAYLEAKEPADVAATAEKLTPAELKWANFLKAWFSTAESYLVKKEGMESRFSGAYAPHVNRGWPEILRDLKEQGLWKSLKEFAPQGDRKAGDFVDAQGNILGFNKFFKQTQFRSGELVPSKNVVEAANRYISDFYHKAALDQIAPVLDTLARAMKAPPEESGLSPQENQAMTSSLQDFVKAYVNNKKGINNSAGAVGELLAPALRMSQTLAALHYIAGNYALQAIKGSVAIPISEYMALGTDLFKAKALKYTEQGGKILEKYESFTGKSPWQEVKRPGADARDFASMLTYGGFGLAHKAAMEDILLGSMTKEEFAKGEISDARLNEIRQHAGRWLDLHGSDSIMGSSQPGKTFTQYKSWAIPPTLTLAEDARALARQVAGKGKMSEVQVREALRLASLAAVTATAGTLVTKDMEDDSFRGQAVHYLRRALGSVWHGLDPAFFFSVAGPGYVAKLAADLHLLGTLERDKNDELKGVKAFKRDLTPRIVKDAQKAFSED